MPFHIDYRPKDLDEFIGNEATVESLRKTLGRKDKFHAYLFIGPRGCGKTTLARIAATKLGCSNVDLEEINAANNRGIETARAIVSNVAFLPMAGNVRVYIFDEVHMATREFWNALLKILEEPPTHVYFMLCTTEPEKLPKTVRSRCAIFPVALQPERTIVKFLKQISKKTGLPMKNIRMIAQYSEGSPREALILFEQYADSEAQKVEVHQEQVINLCRAIWKGGKWNELAGLLKGIQDDPERTRLAVLSYCNSILLSEDNPKAAIIMGCFKDPLYNSGRAGLTLMVYDAWSEVNG